MAEPSGSLYSFRATANSGVIAPDKALTHVGTYNMRNRLGLPCCRQLGNGKHFSKCNENSCQNSNSPILFVALGGFAVVSERKIHAFEQGGGNLAIVANVTVEEEIYDSAGKTDQPVAGEASDS